MKARLPAGMGGGPQNQKDLMRKAQRMQEQLAEKQAELEADFRGKEEALRQDFAAKEAVMKALGHGFEEISFLDIEIFHEKTSAPKVRLSGNAQKYRDELGIKNLEISISHDAGLATAICIAN